MQIERDVLRSREGYILGRPQNPARRVELLTQLLTLTGRQPLSRMTFRIIAAELGVSTYTLVYHFGTRAEMIEAVLSEAVRVRGELIGGMDEEQFTRAEMAEWLRSTCRNILQHEQLPGLRLQFEVGALERLDPDVGTQVSEAYQDWIDRFAVWLARNGVAQERAGILSRMMSDAVTGVQFGHMLTQDHEQTIQVFDIFLDHFMEAVLPSPAA